MFTTLVTTAKVVTREWGKSVIRQRHLHKLTSMQHWAIGYRYLAEFQNFFRLSPGAGIECQIQANTIKIIPGQSQIGRAFHFSFSLIPMHNANIYPVIDLQAHSQIRRLIHLPPKQLSLEAIKFLLKGLLLQALGVQKGPQFIEQ